jgi:hypothetical protein
MSPPSDLGEEGGIELLPVLDRRFGDAAPELLRDHLAAALAFGPLIVGGKRTRTVSRRRAAEVDGDRPGRVKNRSVAVHRKSPYWQMLSTAHLPTAVRIPLAEWYIGMHSTATVRIWSVSAISTTE